MTLRALHKDCVKDHNLGSSIFLKEYSSQKPESFRMLAKGGTTL